MSTSALKAKRPACWTTIPTQLLACSVSFLTLPEHLLVWARVCRAWQAAAKSSLSWPESLTLTLHKNRLPSKWQQQRLVDSYGLRVRHLEVCMNPSLAPVSCEQVPALLAGLAPSLLGLSINEVAGCPVLPRLETLSLSGYNNSVLAEYLLGRGRFPALTGLVW
jgi:hypothetical protein